MKKLLSVIVFVVVASAVALVYFQYQSNQPQPDKEQLQSDIAAAEESYKKDVTSTESFYTQLLSIEQYLDSLTKRQKAGSLFMVNIFGTSLTDEAKQLINRNHPGGIIMMSGNITGPVQLTSLISNVRITTDYEMLIAVDQEGYPVARVEWEKYADANTAVLGANTSAAEISEMYSSRSKQLSKLGFDINFAPVADISYPGSWVTDRSFSSDSAKVTNIVTAIVKQDNPGGTTHSVKHFPGLGRATIDSHAQLPVIDASKADMMASDLLPFQSAISAGIPTVMIGHAIYPNLDADNPASVSKLIQTDLLRGEMDFYGVIVSDDMKMGALDGIENRYAKAVLAGTNIVVLIDTYDKIDAAVTQVSTQVDEAILNERLRKVIKTLLGGRV
ncbi:MAG: glycoside hydrolase family 3 N-terminal domain-containing protein [Candidatus Dojkabacteria bacterium]